MVWDFANKFLFDDEGNIMPEPFEYPDPGLISEPPGSDPTEYPGYELEPPPEEPPIFDGPGGDLEPDVASGLSPEVIGKLPSWLQTLLRNGTLSPTTAAGIIRQFIPDFKPPGTGDGGGGNNNNNNNSNAIDPTLLAAALSTAYNHYKDSDRYIDMSEKYADQLDPFGKQRPMYQEQLARLMTDPEGYVKNDPAYQSMLRLTLNPVESKMRARGYGNSGNILSELTRVAGDTTNKYVGDLRKDLGQFAGSQFGPASAASILQTGMQGSINSRNQALGDIFAGIRGSGASGPLNSAITGGMDWIMRLINGFRGGDGGNNNGSTLPGTNVIPPGFPTHDDEGNPMPDPVFGFPPKDDEGNPMPKMFRP